MSVPLPESPAGRAAAGLAVFDGRGGDTLFSRIMGFAPGARVLTPEGEVAVEALRAGDVVLDAEGGRVRVLWRAVRRLDAAAMGRRPGAAAVRIAAGAMGRDLPVRALDIAPDQAVMTPDGAVVAAHLVDGGAIGRVAGGACYVTIGLDGPGALVVNGLACPAGVVASAAAAVVRRRGAAVGALRSQVETVGDGRVVGWALDVACPVARVALEVRIDGVAVGWGIADQRRPDLEMAGLGDGGCAFDIRFDPPPESGHGRVLEVRRAEDGSQLDGSPVLLLAPAAGSLVAALDAAVGIDVAETLVHGMDAAVLAAALLPPFRLERGL